MRDALAQLFSYVLAIWRHRWVALGVAWLVAMAGWAYVWKLPESYVATARLYVDTNTVLRPLMRGLTVTPDVEQRISMMSRTLLSRPNLEKLSRMTDLDLGVSTEAQEEALLGRLERSISLVGDRANRSLYSISVTNPDRDMARRIAQSLITVFIETSESDKREDSSGAQEFLDQQIATSEQRLIEAESRLAQFKQRNVDILPGQGGDYYSRLQSTRSELAQVNLQLREAENRRNELRRQIEGEDPVFIAGAGSSDTPLSTRIQALQLQKDALLARYTEKHPEVVQLQGLIAELEAEQQAQYTEIRSGGLAAGHSGFASSPVYQGMRTMLAESEAQVAELRVRVAEYERRVADLTAKVSEIPKVEAELKQLTRDYDVLADQHQDMLQRRESARLAEDVENTTGNITFRVIDPPYVPLRPSEPNKLLLNSAVLVLALGAGGALALVLALVNPIVTDARMLAQAAELPLLGTVTWNKSAEQARADRWQLARFAACGLLLLFVFTGLTFAPAIMA